MRASIIAKTLLVAANFMLADNHATAQKQHKAPTLKSNKPKFTDEDWKKDYRPFRIAGNLYYVGTYDLASYLITTPAGHILINTGIEGSEAMIRAHIEALGFNFSDIKILLATHAHFDHVAAMATIKKMTGAKLMIEEEDAQVMTDGGNSDFIYGGQGSMFDPVKPDRKLKDHEVIKLGGMAITILHHPGHTKGASSYLFDVADENHSYRVLIANMPSVLDEARLPTMATYPDIGRDYAYTFNSLKQQHFDIWLSSHASQFNLHYKHPSGAGYHPEAFIDRNGYDMKVDSLEQKYLKRLVRIDSIKALH